VGVFEFFLDSTHSTVNFSSFKKNAQPKPKRKQTKKMVEMKPLLRNEYERLSKVGSFISRL
jgi:hypothetical protein